MCRADPTQKQAVGTGVLYNHQIVNVLQGRTARPLPAIQQGERQHVTVGTLTITNNLSLQSPDGGATMGGIAAHGYVNGKAGAARQG